MDALDLPVVYYDAKHVPDDRPGSQRREMRHFHAVRDDLVFACSLHGPTGPDNPSTDVTYFVLDGPRSDGRYQYAEVSKPEGMTVEWLADVVEMLDDWPHWGVGIRGIPEGYLLVFRDKLMVTGKTFRRCRSVASVVRRARAVLEVDAVIQSCHDDDGLERLCQIPRIEKIPFALRGMKGVTDHGLSLMGRFRGLLEAHLYGCPITEAGLAHLEPLVKLKELSLYDARIGDGGLASLAKLPRLERLVLTKTDVTDAGLDAFTGARKLTELDLSLTAVTDAGLAGLSQHRGLRTLGLFGCKITDAGVIELAKMRKLTKLDLRAAGVSPTALEGLKKILPDCSIEFDRH